MLNERKFEWGRWDCFAYIVEAARLDVSHLPPRRYRTQTGAMLYLKRNGFASLADLVDSLAEPRAVGYAQRGDILMREGCLGMCTGGFGVFLTEDGFERLSTFESERAWRVVR